MLIDWITACVDLEGFSPKDQAVLRSHGDRIQRYNPRTGVVVWEVPSWESIRSDSHQISVRVSGDRLFVQGSPARVIGDGDAAFGAGPARALDLVGCVARMAEVGCGVLGVSPPADIQDWKLTRCDVTSMLALPSLADVRAALGVLRNCEGGRYRVSQQAGDTVYWSSKSRLKAGKAYAKGPHLRWAQGKRDYEGRRYIEAELSAVDRCLRLELRLGAQFWRERAGGPWYKVTGDELRAWHGEYFGRMLGSSEVTEMNIEERVRAVAASAGQAKAAVATWGLIKAFGWEKARDMTTRAKWYKDLKMLREAGLGDADTSSGTVVPFRRRLIEYQEVQSWEELMSLVDQRAA